MDETIDRFPGPFDFDLHPFRIVQDPSTEPVPRRELIYERPEPDALNYAGDRELLPDAFRRFQSRPFHSSTALGSIL
jgi:hypothetical protein